jgi:hypothetical protein
VKSARVGDNMSEERGVIEESSPRDDERVFTLRGNRGKWCGTIRLPTEDVTADTIRWLWQVLQLRDSVRLTII